MTQDDIISAARECLGTRFKHQGRLVGRALDCAGVVCHVAVRIGLCYDAPTDYPRTPYQGLLESTLDGQACLERVSDMQPGDILLMRFMTDPQHLAIWTGSTIIHAYESVGKCCEHRMDDAWRARVMRVYRFRGLA